MILESDNQRPEIKYPCEWGYKVIGTDVNKILHAIEEASMGLTPDITPSNISKNGKYFSINFTVEVPNEVVRNLVYEKLKNNPEIKIVI
jgi:putative lipoic acid-binding regulatory protein